MPKQAHHCAATNGCSGQPISGQNCPKCQNYNPCAGGCGNYVLRKGKTCPQCTAKAAADAKRAKDAAAKKAKEEAAAKKEKEEAAAKKAKEDAKKAKADAKK